MYGVCVSILAHIRIEDTLFLPLVELVLGDGPPHEKNVTISQPCPHEVRSILWGGLSVAHAEQLLWAVEKGSVKTHLL